MIKSSIAYFQDFDEEESELGADKTRPNIKLRSWAKQESLESIGRDNDSDGVHSADSLEPSSPDNMEKNIILEDHFQAISTNVDAKSSFKSVDFTEDEEKHDKKKEKPVVLVDEEKTENISWCTPFIEESSEISHQDSLEEVN